MKIYTVPDLMVDTLQKAGVECTYYGLSGGSLNGTEAPRARDAIERVHMSHEENEAFEALGQWMALTPHELWRHLDLDRALMDAMPAGKYPVGPPAVASALLDGVGARMPGSLTLMG